MCKNLTCRLILWHGQVEKYILLFSYLWVDILVMIVFVARNVEVMLFSGVCVNFWVKDNVCFDHRESNKYSREKQMTKAIEKKTHPISLRCFNELICYDLKIDRSEFQVASKFRETESTYGFYQHIYYIHW